MALNRRAMYAKKVNPIKTMPRPNRLYLTVPLNLRRCKTCSPIVRVRKYNIDEEVLAVMRSSNGLWSSNCASGECENYLIAPHRLDRKYGHI